MKQSKYKIHIKNQGKRKQNLINSDQQGYNLYISKWKVIEVISLSFPLAKDSDEEVQI